MTRTRQTIGQGLYLDAHGVTVLARIGSGAALREARARFPLVDDDGIPYSKKNCSELVKCRLQLLEDLRRQRATDGSAAGTLGAAIDRWMADHPKPSPPITDADRPIEDLRCLLAAWRREPMAAIPLEQIRRAHVREQLLAWRKAKLSVSTVKHRRRALAKVLERELNPDGDLDVALPTDQIGPVGPPRRPEPRAIPIPIVMRLLAALADLGRSIKGQPRSRVSATKIRLRVMAWTGLPPKSLMRLERRHVNFRDEKLYQPPRQKGTGAAGQWVDLLPPAVAALRDFDAAGLWGRFAQSSPREAWQRALTRVERELRDGGETELLEQFLVAVPKNCRPYDLRHSLLTELLRQSKDIYATQKYAQHSNIKTTEQYLKSAVPELVAEAVAKMRLAWCPESPVKPAAVLHLVVKKESA
jgi:integrase